MKTKFSFLSEPKNLSRHKIVLFLFLVVLHALDAMFSNIFMAAHLGNEANPVMAHIFSEFGQYGVWLVKTVLFIPLFFLLPYMRQWILWVLNIIMIPIVIMGGIMANGVVL